MTHSLQVFQNDQFGSVRTLDEDGKVLFCGNDVAMALGYQNQQKAVWDHCKGVVKRTMETCTGMKKDGTPAIQHVEMAFIPESDVYRLAAHSRLPAAEKFEKWLYEEVLPSIRKYGAYIPDQEQLMEQTVKVATEAAMAAIEAIMPMLQQRMEQEQAQYKPPQPRRRVRPQWSLIGALDTDLRQEVENMIFSRQYTYNDISNLMYKQYGVLVSKSSIGRYALEMYTRMRD